MTKRITTWLSGLALVGLLAMTPWLAVESPVAQTTVSSTTLSSAVTSTGATTVVLTSGANAAAGYVLFVDKELMLLQSAIGGTTTQWNVVRGFDGTRAATHASGAPVYLGARERFYRNDVSGTCPATESFTPHINIVSGRIFECEAGFWLEWSSDLVRVREHTVRENFDVGATVMQDDGTAKSLTDAEINYVSGSVLGGLTYREEQAKTASSWITINGYLDISGDGTDDEGVEIVFGDGTNPTLNQFLEAGTQGGCVAAAITMTDASGSDNLQLGFRQNEAFVDAANYAGYTVWNTVGLNTTDGSIISSQEVSEATDTDDSAVNWADGETRALKVCLSKAGVPTAFFSDAFTPSLVNIDRPKYNAIDMTETGSTFTAGIGVVPFLTFLHRSDVAEATRIHWVQLTRLP